jgi:hypothetical protein
VVCNRLGLYVAHNLAHCHRWSLLTMLSYLCNCCQLVFVVLRGAALTFAAVCCVLLFAGA